MVALILATYLLQAAAGGLTALMLLHFRRVFRREDLRFWGLSWAALAVHHAVAGAAFILATAQPAASIARMVAVAVLLIAVFWHIAWLSIGTRAIRGVQVPDVARRRALMLILAALGVGLMVVTLPLAPGWRHFVRIGAPALVSSIAFFSLAIVMLRLPRSRGAIGAVMLGVAASIYATGRAVEFVVNGLNALGMEGLGIFAFSALVDLIMEVAMALGTVIWLLEEERATATSTAAALATSEARFRRLVDHARLIAWEFDPATKSFTYVSPQAEDLLGFSLEQWREPEFWYHRLHPDDRDAARAYSHAQCELGLDHAFEYRMIRADGSVAWFRDLTSVERGNEARTRLQGVLIDVSERVEAERALRESEARYRAIVEDQTELICRLCPDGLITFVNEAYCRYFDRAQEDLIGRSLFDRMAPLDAARLRETLSRLTAECPSATIELCEQMPDGSVRWRQWTDRAIFDEEGRLCEYQAVGRDITERRLAEEALRRSEARFRAIFESAVDPLWDWDIVADRTTFSPGWARMLEYDPAAFEREGRTWAEHVHPDDLPRVSSILHTALRDESRPYEAEYRLRTRDGTWIWVLSRGCVAAHDAAGRPTRMIGGISDITQRKHAEQALYRSNELQRLLLGELDHRVRNNLASLAALVDISARDSASVPEFAQSIRRRVQAMSVVHSMLSQQQWQSIDLQQLLATLAPVGSQEAVHLHGPPVQIMPRQATALGMVVQELFANSQKYGSLAASGVIEVTWRVEHALTASGQSTLQMRWCERGGPRINQSPREGVGTGLIHGLARTELGGEVALRFPPEGAEHEFTLSLDAAVSDGERRSLAHAR